MRRGRSQRLAAANAVRLRRGGPARLQQQQATLCSIIVSTMLEQFVGSSRMVTMYSAHDVAIIRVSSIANRGPAAQGAWSPEPGLHALSLYPVLYERGRRQRCLRT